VVPVVPPPVEPEPLICIISPTQFDALKNVGSAVWSFAAW
jgi:hypothetical protein